MELVLLWRILALVEQRDDKTLVQEGELAQALRQRIEVERGRFHDRRVGLEGDLRSGLIARLTGLLKPPLRDAALVLLLPGCLVAPDLELQQLRKRVDTTHADAVQPAGDLVRV